MHIGSQVIIGTMMTPPPTPTMLPNAPASTPVLILSIATSLFVPLTSCGWGSSDICLAPCPLAVPVPVHGPLLDMANLLLAGTSSSTLKFPTQIPRLAPSPLIDPFNARRIAVDEANASILFFCRRIPSSDTPFMIGPAQIGIVADSGLKVGSRFGDGMASFAGGGRERRRQEEKTSQPGGL